MLLAEQIRGIGMNPAFENFINSRWERLLDNVLRNRLEEAFVAGQKSAARQCKDLLNQRALAKDEMSHRSDLKMIKQFDGAGENNLGKQIMAIRALNRKA